MRWPWQRKDEDPVIVTDERDREETLRRLARVESHVRVLQMAVGIDPDKEESNGATAH